MSVVDEAKTEFLDETFADQIIDQFFYQGAYVTTIEGQELKNSLMTLVRKEAFNDNEKIDLINNLQKTMKKIESGVELV